MRTDWIGLRVARYCPDAVTDAQAGHLAPRGGYDRSTPTLHRLANGLAARWPAPGRNDRGWYSA